ncbi:MAG: sigma-70 family RNA polymerase sigma factor [Planctomycetes bacterium]|nr:sigma-70 family RNA polymerase sigma factor [Planctomycetota bacterium]
MTTRKQPHELTCSDPAEWVDEYGDSLYRYAVSKIGDRDIAEDLVQETLLAALSGVDSFRGKSSSLTWFIGILRRKIVDEFRRRERDIDGRDAAPAAPLSPRRNMGRHRHRHEQFADCPAEPEAVLEQHEFWEVLDDCVTSMPSHFAAAFLLRDMYHEDTDTVCEQLEISPANLFVRLHRARLILRRCLESKWFDRPTSNSK